MAVISHHVQPLSEANCTAPHEYFSQTGTPSTSLASCRVKIALLEAVLINSYAVGIFAYTSAFDLKPFGGHFGEGEGESFDFILCFVLATVFFFTTGFLLVAAFLILDFEAGAFLALLVFELGDGDLLAASDDGAIKVATIAKISNGLITIPPKFSYREKHSNCQPKNENGECSTGFPGFCNLLAGK